MVAFWSMKRGLSIDGICKFFFGHDFYGSQGFGFGQFWACFFSHYQDVEVAANHGYIFGSMFGSQLFCFFLPMVVRVPVKGWSYLQRYHRGYFEGFVVPASDIGLRLFSSIPPEHGNIVFRKRRMLHCQLLPGQYLYVSINFHATSHL